MSGLNPSAPSQPTLEQAYTTPGNPAGTQPAEEAKASDAQSRSGRTVDTRIPEKQSAGFEDATPSSLGRGVRGAPPGEESQGLDIEDVGRHKELDGEQMRAPGEGEVKDSVDLKPGASGQESDFASDLDRKKAEQAPARAAVKQESKQAMDVGGALADRGGPANPVD